MSNSAPFLKKTTATLASISGTKNRRYTVFVLLRYSTKLLIMPQTMTQY